MRWLWMVSVGVTDVQFPVWTKDELNRWVGPWRFESGRTGIRAVHEGLLTLLAKGQLRFEADLARPLDRALMRELRLDFMVEPETGEFAAAVRCDSAPEAFRIDAAANEIPNPQAPTLPLYFPKLEPLVAKARELLADQAVSVLVLNTRRAERFGADARDEPIASGPLVARLLAERLGLDWCDSSGQLPESFGAGMSTWIDMLIEQEAMEDPDAQAHAVARLNAALSAWTASGQAEPRVLLTTSGGMPALKPLIERVPAIHLGPSRVSVLEQPERQSGAQVSALSYGARIAERESLRFHAAEALRQGDYAGAYGIARRATGQGWAGMVKERLGALLELPGKPIQLKQQALEPFALHACQAELRWCMGDVVGGLLRLGPFIESAVWALIESDARIRELGLTIDRANESLVGDIPGDHPLLSSSFQYFRPDPEVTDQHRVNGLNWLWPRWLTESEGGQRDAAVALDQVCFAYNNDRIGISPRQYRNLLAHGSDQAIDLNELTRCLKSRGLMAGVGRGFGENALATERIAALLAGLGAADLGVQMNRYLNTTLQRVVEG